LFIPDWQALPESAQRKTLLPAQECPQSRTVSHRGFNGQPLPNQTLYRFMTDSLRAMSYQPC
jgi:hypothetical protein